MKGALSAQKLHQGSETNFRELMARRKVMNVLPDEGVLGLPSRQINDLLQKAKRKKIVSGQTCSIVSLAPAMAAFVCSAWAWAAAWSLAFRPGCNSKTDLQTRGHLCSSSVSFFWERSFSRSLGFEDSFSSCAWQKSFNPVQIFSSMRISKLYLE